MRSMFALPLVLLSFVIGCGEAAPSSTSGESDQAALNVQHVVRMHIAKGAAADAILDKVMMENPELVQMGQEFLSVRAEGYLLECTDGLCLLSFESNADPSLGAPFSVLVGEEHEQGALLASLLFKGLGKTTTGGVKCKGSARSPAKATCEIEGTVTEVERAGARAGGGGYRATGGR